MTCTSFTIAMPSTSPTAQRRTANFVPANPKFVYNGDTFNGAIVEQQLKDYDRTRWPESSSPVEGKKRSPTRKRRCFSLDGFESDSKYYPLTHLSQTP